MRGEVRIEGEDTLRRILTVEGALDETTGGMVKSVEEFNEELYCNQYVTENCIGSLR